MQDPRPEIKAALILLKSLDMEVTTCDLEDVAVNLVNAAKHNLEAAAHILAINEPPVAVETAS